MKTKSFLTSLLAVALLVGLTVSCEDEFQPQPQDQNLELKGKPINPLPIVYGVDGLETEVISDNIVGTTLSVTMKVTLTPDEGDFVEGQPVKTQGGLTANAEYVKVTSDEAGEIELSASMVKVKNTKKNTVISITEAEGVGAGPYVYYVFFTKELEDIDCEVEDDLLTGDWTTKYPVYVTEMDWYPTPEDPDVFVTYTGWTDKQIGYAEEIALSDLGTSPCE